MILITGATGNNGRELVRQLTAMGQQVRAFVRDPANAAKLKGPNLEMALGDFDQPKTLDAALQGVQKAFLLTAVAERFVQWQTDFIEAARRAKVKHVVKFSGMGAHAGSASQTPIPQTVQGSRSMTVLRFEERSSSRTQNLVTPCRDQKRSAKGGNGINSESASGFMPQGDLAPAKGAATGTPWLHTVLMPREYARGQAPR